MKLAISAKSDDLNSEVDRQFGKAPFLLIVDTNNRKFESIPVKSQEVKEGNEGQIASLICSKSVDAVLTGVCEDDIFQIFRKSNIVVSETAYGNVRELIKDFIQNHLSTSYSNNTSNIPFWISGNDNKMKHYIKNNSINISKNQTKHDYIY